MTKRITAIIAAFVLLYSSAMTAFADTDKKAITDAWFEYKWENSGGAGVYASTVGEEVPISQDPIAATGYARLSETVNYIDKQGLLEELQVDPTDEYSIRQLNKTYFGWWESISTDKGLLLLYDYGIMDYEDGEWILDADDGDVYQRIKFVDNGDSFTMVAVANNEELGTYSKVYGFDTDTDNDSATGGSATGGGGSAGGSGSSGNNGTTSKSDSSSKHPTDAVTASTVISSNSNSSVSSTGSYPDKVQQHVYDTDNPAVTPEVVSAVDAMKDTESENNTEEARAVTADTVTSSSGLPAWAYLIIGLVIGGVAVFIMYKKKGAPQ